MSLIIKGMDMLRTGVYNAVITFDGDCLSVRIPPSKEPFFSGRIVHMPTPHGRLIDADAFLEENKEFANRDFIHPKYECTLRDLIDSAPTIIEAEVRE